MINDEITLYVDDDEYQITFWAKEGAVAENGKYSDYVVLAFRPCQGDYWMLRPDGSTEGFYAVMKKYDDDEGEDFMRLIEEYIRPYRVRGKQISSEEINFYDTEDLEMELSGIISCMAEDPVPDGDGMEPFCFDEDWFD